MDTPTESTRLTATEALFDFADATPELFEALVAAQADVKTLGKDGTNTHARYKYTTADAMVSATRQIATGHGLAVIHSHAFDHDPDNTSGTTWREGWLEHELHLLHKAGGRIAVRSRSAVVCTNRTPVDKAIMASATYALGFMLRSLFQVDRDENPDDVDQRDDQDFQRGGRRGQAKGQGGRGRPKPNTAATDYDPDHPETIKHSKLVKRWVTACKVIEPGFDWKSAISQIWGEAYSTHPSMRAIGRANKTLGAQIETLERRAAAKTKAQAEGEAEPPKESEAPKGDDWQDKGPPEDWDGEPGPYTPSDGKGDELPEGEG